MVRWTIHFAGHVQGVGFRYMAQSIARDHAIAGYVQNLADGRVRLVIEGESVQLQAYLDAVLHAMASYVRSHTVDVGPANGEFGSPEPGSLRVRRGAE